MSSASTIASVVVALAAVLVVIRWPRPRADRRVLERRAHSLEALGMVVTRSASTRADAVARHTSDQAPAESDTSSYRHLAITVLGPVGAADSDDAQASDGRLPERAHGHRPGRPSSRRHRGPTHRHITPPTPLVVQLGPDDLPPDETLTQTVSSLTGAEERPVGSPASPTAPSLTRATPDTATDPAPDQTRLVTAPPRRQTLRAIPLGSRRATLQPRHPLRRWTAAAVAVVAVLGGLTAALVRPDAAQMQQVPGSTASATPTDPLPTTDTTLPEPLTPTSAIGDSVTFALPPPFILELAAGDTTWVRVQGAEGEVLFEGTLAPNDTTTVPTTGPVQLRVGNPAGLLIAADGQLIDHPRPPGQPITLALG